MSTVPSIAGFYISDLSGIQSPYTEELFRVNQERNVQARIERAQLARPQTTLPETNTLSSANTAPSAAPNISGGANIGQAGATALYRGRGSDTSSANEPQSSTNISDENAQRRHRPDVQAVTKATPIQSKERDLTTHEEAPPPEIRKNPYDKLDEPLPKRAKALRAEQIMTPEVLSLAPSDIVQNAREIFQTHRFRHIPVVTAEAKVIGIVSDRDVLSLAEDDLPVSAIMTTPVLSARPNTEIRHIARMMFHERIGAMPIVGEDEKIVGILTRSDILRTVINKAPLELWV